MIRKAAIKGGDRFWLLRDWSDGDRNAKTIVFVMLNPSTANGCVDDPTVRKCIGFATRLGYKRMLVVNLFSKRATNPRELRHGVDRWFANAAALRKCLGLADCVVFGWGASLVHAPLHTGRQAVLMVMRFAKRLRIKPMCLGTSKDGHPRHPLMLPYTTQLMPWKGYSASEWALLRYSSCVTPKYLALAVWFVVVALIVWWVRRRRAIVWPKGSRAARTTVLGNRVVVIDAPGTDGEKLLLIDACATACVSIFTAWRSWRPNDQGAELVFPLVGVHFVDDATMKGLHVQQGCAETCIMWANTGAGISRVPFIVIRKANAAAVVSTGQPVIHELLHILLEAYLPMELGDGIEHTHVAWHTVQGAANETFNALYSPEAVNRRRSGPPKGEARP